MYKLLFKYSKATCSWGLLKDPQYWTVTRPSILAIQKVQWDSTVLENQTLVFEAKIVRKSLTFF